MQTISAVNSALAISTFVSNLRFDFWNDWSNLKSMLGYVSDVIILLILLVCYFNLALL